MILITIIIIIKFKSFQYTHWLDSLMIDHKTINIIIIIIILTFVEKYNYC